jgi:hypothetical protein
VDTINDHEELCPAFSDPKKDCVCEIIYKIIVEEDYKKSECIQIAFDEGIDCHKEEIIKKILEYKKQVLSMFDEAIASDQHHGTMLFYSSILETIDICKKIIEEP